jgi:hypothetical protein
MTRRLHWGREMDDATPVEDDEARAVEQKRIKRRLPTCTEIVAAAAAIRAGWTEERLLGLTPYNQVVTPMHGTPIKRHSARRGNR